MQNKSTKKIFLFTVVILLFLMIFSVVRNGSSSAADTSSNPDSTSSDTETTETSTSVSSADWMSEIDDATMLSAISIPGTHDSCTQYVGLSYIFQCQDTDIATQLENGYRYLDLRLVIDDTDDEQTLIIKHNFSACKNDGSFLAADFTLSDVLDDVTNFLADHPSETVILCMKAENSEDDISTLQDLLYAQMEEYETRFDETLWYTANEIPSLSDVRGKIVLATRFEDASGVGSDNSGLHFDWEDQGARIDEAADVKTTSKINDTSSLIVQDFYNFDVDDKLTVITDSLDNCNADDTTFSINFTSTSGSGYIGHPKKYAAQINETLLSYDWKPGTCYGIVVVDFGTEDLAKKIYSTNIELMPCKIH